jgi:hypothetical protein
MKDEWGWGEAQYSIRKGFKFLPEERSTFLRSKIWNLVWHPDRIPKINSFIWLVAHNKILTAENLRKRGMHGASRCVLCQQQEESLQHLFFHCIYSKEVWEIALGDLSHFMNWPNKVMDFFNNWNKHYIGRLYNKPELKHLW